MSDAGCVIYDKNAKNAIFDVNAYAMSRYGNMGVKRSVRTSRIQINTIKQLMNWFNSLKLQNIDFANFPLYFSKFPLYNVRPFPVGKFFT